MKKRLLSFILASVMVVGALSVGEIGVLASDQTNELTFADLTQEQLDIVRSGGRVSGIYKSQLSNKPDSNKAPKLPKTFSLQDEGVVTNVGNQGAYGTCWAFSALTASETNLMKHVANVNLSESHLSWFTYSTEDQRKAFEYIFGDYDEFDNGGFDFTATGTLANWFGPAPEEDFPYSNNAIPSEYRDASVAHLQNVISFPDYEENGTHDVRETLVNQVKSQMYKYKQAVDIAYLVIDEDSRYNPETNAWYNPFGSYTNHAVTIVGWDDNFSKENFYNSQYLESDGAWLVQNSWGEFWGDNGFFWLSYEDVTIDYVGLYFYESSDNYGKMHSHDESVQYTPVGFDNSTEIYMANVFESDAQENLEAVSFYTTDVSTAYTVKIYTGLTDEKNPTSGVLKAKLSGIKELPGYYTETLKNSVALNAGEKFSVVIYLENPTQTLTAQVEGIYMDYRIQSDQDVSNPGESFVSSNGKKWEDIHQKIIRGFDGLAYMRLGNFAIKAFTNTDKYVKFSIEAGEVPFLEDLELSCLSADEIYYTTDGSNPKENGKLYTDPIVLKDGMTVKAVAKRDGEFGKIYSKKYKQASASLSGLMFKTDDKKWVADGTKTVIVDNRYDFIEIIPFAQGDITINSTKVRKGESFSVDLEEYKRNTIKIVVEADGYKTQEYVYSAYINPIKYNFQEETMLFNDKKVSVKTKYNQSVTSGQSVTGWLDQGSMMSFNVKIGGYEILVNLPRRYELKKPEIDYIYECSTEIYEGQVFYKFSQEEEFIENWSTEDDYIPAFPGETMYLYRKATDEGFASDVVKWEIPERPDIGDRVSIEYIKKTKIKFVYDENLCYWMDETGYASDGVFKKLLPGEEYTISVYQEATNESFCSDVVGVYIVTETDSAFETYKADMKANETDSSFATAFKAFFARSFFAIRWFFTRIFE